MSEHTVKPESKMHRVDGRLHLVHYVTDEKGERINEFPGSFLTRALSAYIVTFAVGFLLLWLFDKAPLDDLRVALTRTVLVAFPASFAAVAVDFIR